MGHSLLLIHSGLQSGGLPIKSGRQEHEGALFATSHLLLNPHGDGMHGLTGTGGSAAVGEETENIALTSMFRYAQ